MAITQLPDPLDRLSIREKVLAIVLGCVPDEGDFNLASVSAEAMLVLERDEPVLLQAFMREMAQSTVREIARQRLNEGRLAFYRNQRPLAFQRAAAEFERTGDSSAFGPIMDATYVIDDRSTRRRMRDMTRDDCRYVATRYQESAEQAALKARVWQAIASRVPEGQTVGETFTEEQLAALMNTISD